MAFHFWGENGSELRIYQKVTDIPEGKYTLSASIQGGIDSGDDVHDIYIFAYADDNEADMTKAPAGLSGYADWHKPVTGTVEVPEGGTITIGAYIKAGKGSWGTVDDFMLNPAK